MRGLKISDEELGEKAKRGGMEKLKFIFMVILRELLLLMPCTPKVSLWVTRIDVFTER